MRYLADSLWIAFGASLGANARYWIGFWAKTASQSFPWPTLLINVVGSALLGAFSAAALIRGWGGQSRLFFAVGLCGGFTTFSTFSYEVIALYYERSLRLALAYGVLSLVLSVGGCFLGGHLVRVSMPSSASPNENPVRP